MTMRFDAEHYTCEVADKKLNKKRDTKKEISVAFQDELKKTEEANEKSRRRSEGKKEASNAERPKSAGCLPRKGLECGPRKREPAAEAKRTPAQGFQIRETSCRNGLRCECASLLDLESKCSSWCGCRARSCLCDYQTNWWMGSGRYKAEAQRRRCSSNPNFSKSTFDKEKDLYKVKRSLKLIGLELSDFGLYSHGGAEVIPECKLKRNPSTFSTRVIERSFSLESLRHAVRRAWLEDRLDESHRKLLSQAAYEEWYFRKEKELEQKQKRERQEKALAKANIKMDLERKKAKAEEEFKKWMQRKRIRRKEKENLEKPSEHCFGRIRKTNQNREAAFLKWKKEKDKELEKKKREKKKEEEMKTESERRKLEKKMIAEKAFQQWKMKVEETQKLEEGRRKKLQKKQEELERRQKQDERSKISFQVWKKTKDKVHQQMKQIREMTKLQREENQSRMEERMYEAERAFEEWLEEIDLRKQKPFCNNLRKIPWIPC